MADESFPLPGSSYKQIEKIVTSYAELNGEAGPAEVAQLAGTDATNVSRNNKFLVATGIIEGGQKKRITTLGQELARAIRFDKTEEQSDVWGRIVDSNEFLQKIISAVRIRRGMDSPTLVNHIAFSAGGAKNAATMAGAGAVLDILIKGNALIDQGGLLTAIEKSSKAPSEAPAQTSKHGESTVPVTKFYGGGYPITSNLFSSPDTLDTTTGSEVETSIRINIQVNCTAEELESLGPKLKKLLAELNKDEEVVKPRQLEKSDGLAATEGE